MNKAYLEITMKVPAKDRVTAGAIYSKYKPPFLATIPGAESKELLLREEDVQVLHGFDSRASEERAVRQRCRARVEALPLGGPGVRVYERQ